MNLKMVEKKTVIADANKTTSLGTYIPGIYSVDAKRNRIWRV